jgi:hypothetical protein
VQRPPSTIAPISFDRQQLVSPDVASVASAAPAARRPPTRTISSILWRGSAAAALLVAVIAGVAFSSRGSLPKHHAAGASSYTGIVAAAATSTRSSPALQAFVDGEDAYGNGRYGAAVKFFRAALAQDSNFALAHYRLSESMLWQEEPDGFAAVHDSLALRWSSKLSDEDRRLIRGYVAWRRGEYEVADTLDRSVIRADGNNVEAQFQFGEVLFHYNPLRGRSIGEAGGWFDHLLSLDSTNWGARWHLLLLDASRIGPSAFHDRVAQLLDAKPDGHLAAELRLFAADRDELPRLASSATSAMLFDAAWRRAVFRRDLAGAETLLTRMTMRGRNEYDHSLGSFAIAALRFGRGSVTTAIPMLEIDEAKRVSAGDAPVILVHGLLANHADTAVDLDSLGRAIERWRQTLAGFDRPTSTPPIVADYLEGLLAVARGDTARARQAAMALEDLDRRHDPNLSPEFRRPADLAHTIRAYGDFRSGRCESALRELDAEKGVYWLGVIASSPLASQSFERYVRAECLLSLGRSAEAVTWFESLEQGTLYDLEFLAASLQGQAQAHRAIGDADATRAIEQRLAELRTK